MEIERLLIDTEMPAGEVIWLEAAGVTTLRQLARLTHEEIEALPDFKGEYYLTILLVGVDEGVPMMGWSLAEMAKCAADIVGHPVTAKETLRRLASFQERCILFGHKSPLVA